MSRIDELIKQYAPDGVEYKALGDVARIKAGPNINRRMIAERPGDYPVINSGRDPLGYVDSYNVEDDPIGIASRGSVGLVTWTPGRFFRGNLNYSCSVQNSDLLDARFLFHYLLSVDAKIQALATHSGIPALNAGALKTLPVPVPPLNVQREIVRVLDIFTELEAELEAELDARRVQYAHYRDTLLSFSEDDGVTWATLGDVCVKVSSGGTPPSGRGDYYGGEIPWLRTQEVDYTPIRETGVTITEAGLRNSSAKWIPANCVIVAMYGATAAKVAVSAIPLTTNQACCNLEVNPTKAEFRYVFHWIANEYERLRALGEGSQSNLNAQKIKSFPIPVPRLEEQRRIVAMLDKFDDLTSDLTSGLPAEIEARRAQYAYYRDRLLSFEETQA